MAQSLTSTTSNPLLERADDFARKDPAKAVATAFGFGFLLHLLPLGVIASILVTAVLKMARPVLLLMGVWKAYDLSGVQSFAQK